MWKRFTKWVWNIHIHDDKIYQIKETTGEYYKHIRKKYVCAICGRKRTVNDYEKITNQNNNDNGNN